MSERRPQNKYIPKNFNHELLKRRGRGRDRLINVRNMLPMTIKCNTCSNYHYMGTKFTMRMEICNDEMYLGIKVFRFYFRCTHCMNQITFKTDPKNAEYVVETGGVRNYDPRRDIQEAQKVLKKLKTEEEEGDTMKTLQNKTYDSKREMQLMEVLQQIRSSNKRHATFQSQDLLKKLYEAEILQIAQNQQQDEQMQKQYQRKLQQFNKRKQAQGKISFNEKIILQNQKNQQKKLKEQTNKRKTKPIIMNIVKKRKIESIQQVEQDKQQPVSKVNNKHIEQATLKQVKQDKPLLKNSQQK